MKYLKAIVKTLLDILISFVVFFGAVLFAFSCWAIVRGLYQLGWEAVKPLICIVLAIMAIIQCVVLYHWAKN